MTGFKEQVRERYARAAREASGCCGTAGCSDPITSDLYAADQAGEVPAAALEASLGCGNPTAVAELLAGETVLDLGSGGGIDVLLSARRVGPTGKAYGLDMTHEMLALARRNAEEAGAENVEFLLGEIEAIPLPDQSVDVIISNCVVNLSGDKPRVLREALRVLRPGGRLAISDVMTRGRLPASMREDPDLVAGCIGGALEEGEFRRLLIETGFEGVEIEVTREYSSEEIGELTAQQPGSSQPEGAEWGLMAAIVRGRRPLDTVAASGPEAESCCTTSCCSD